MGANLTIPIPMRDFAKLKILECSTIGQQMNCLEPCVFEILFIIIIIIILFFFFLMGLMSAIGPKSIGSG